MLQCIIIPLYRGIYIGETSAAEHASAINVHRSALVAVGSLTSKTRAGRRVRRKPISVYNLWIPVIAITWARSLVRQVLVLTVLKRPQPKEMTFTNFSSHHFPKRCFARRNGYFFCLS